MKLEITLEDYEKAGEEFGLNIFTSPKNLVREQNQSRF